MRSPEVLTGFDHLLTRAVEIVHGLAQQLEDGLATALRPNAPLPRLVEAIKRLEAGPPVAGYEALLLDNGCPAFEARLMAGAFKWSSQHGLCELFGGTGPEP